MRGTNGERQELNAALVSMAKTGNSFALNQLWELNRGLIRSQLWKMCGSKEGYLHQHGLTMDDLENEMYFAVITTVEKYDPERGSFAECLKWYIQSRLSKVLRGEHCRLVTTEDGRRVQVSANPLDAAAALDEPASGSEDESTTRLDLLADPDGEGAFRAVEESAATEFLCSTVQAAVADLPDRQRQVVYMHRLSEPCKSISAIADEMGISCSRVQQLERSSFKTLLRDPRIRKLHDEVIGTRAYQHTGFNSWKNGGGSVEEWMIELLERKAERVAALAM